MKSDLPYMGGCACGALRYESTAAPGETGYCHCRICQHTSAAPVLAFASFPVADFRYTRGEPAIYRSSGHGAREFCSSCGTQIAYRQKDKPMTVDVNAGSLDEPARVPPRMHIWCDSRIPWFHTADDLPRFGKGKTP